MNADLIGWIGNIFFCLGAILLARKSKLGFYSNGIANLFYVIFAVLIDKSSVFALSIFLISVNIYGIYKWREIKPKQTWRVKNGKCRW